MRLLLSLGICVLLPCFAHAQGRAPHFDLNLQLRGMDAKLAPPTESETNNEETVIVGTVQIQPAGTAVGDPVMRHRAIPGLVISGTIILVVGYVTSLVVALFATAVGDEGSGFGYIPVLGAFIQGAVGGEGLLTYGIIDSAVQIVGLTLLIIGIVGHDEVETGYVHNESGFRFQVLPTVSAQSAGFSALGRF